MLTALSIIAAVLTTVSFLPQAIKAIKGNTKSISLMMYVIFTIGIICWTFYGFATKNVALSIANLLVGILAIVILLNKLRNVFKGVD